MITIPKEQAAFLIQVLAASDAPARMVLPIIQSLSAQINAEQAKEKAPCTDTPPQS